MVSRDFQLDDVAATKVTIHVTIPGQNKCFYLPRHGADGPPRPRRVVLQVASANSTSSSSLSRTSTCTSTCQRSISSTVAVITAGVTTQARASRTTSAIVSGAATGSARLRQREHWRAGGAPWGHSAGTAGTVPVTGCIITLAVRVSAAGSLAGCAVLLSLPPWQ